MLPRRDDRCPNQLIRASGAPTLPETRIFGIGPLPLGQIANFDENRHWGGPSEKDRLASWQRRKLAEKAAQVVWDQSLHQFLVAVVDNPVEQERVALSKYGR